MVIKKVPKRKPRTFISYHHKDRHAKELLKAQDKNRHIPLHFTQTSQDKPFSNKWKNRVKKRIQNSSSVLVPIGKETYKNSLLFLKTPIIFISY